VRATELITGVGRN